MWLLLDLCSYPKLLNGTQEQLWQLTGPCYCLWLHSFTLRFTTKCYKKEMLCKKFNFLLRTDWRKIWSNVWFCQYFFKTDYYVRHVGLTGCHLEKKSCFQISFTDVVLNWLKILSFKFQVNQSINGTETVLQTHKQTDCQTALKVELN